MYVLLLWRKERDELPEGMYNQRGGGGGDGEGDEERDEFPEGDGLRLRLRLRGERGAHGDGLRLRLRLRLRLLAMGCVCRLPGSSGFFSSASKRSRKALMRATKFSGSLHTSVAAVAAVTVAAVAAVAAVVAAVAVAGGCRGVEERLEPCCSSSCSLLACSLVCVVSKGVV